MLKIIRVSIPQKNIQVNRNEAIQQIFTFLTDFTLKDGSLPVFIIKRLKDPSRAEEFVESAKKFLGQPYDVHFLPDNDSLYCSELVRDCYVGPDGEYVFDTVPMNFKDADGEFPLYWRQLFERLNRGELAANSDHYPFAVRGVPCIFLENEDGSAFPYYHTPADNMKTIRFESYEPVFRLITAFVAEAE